MQNLQEYKCPCCGGAIAFDSTAQKLKCPYCDTEFEIETLKGYEEELEGDSADNMEWQTDAGSEWQQGEADGLCNYSCNSCGGEIVADETTAATKCPFCDNPVIMKGRLSGMLKPDYVIPFKLDKKAAKAAYMRHIEGKRLLPKLFRDQNHIDEIKGIYVPFWLFDAEADANVRYHAEIVRTYSDSENNYTETSHYMVQRGGSIGFENVPVDGSEKWRMTLWSPSSLSIFRKRWIFKRHTLRVIWRINTMLMRITASTVQTSESNVPLRRLLLQPLKATQRSGRKQAAFSCITARQNMRFIPFGF